MIIPLLSLALAVVSPAAAQTTSVDVLGPVRRREIGELAADWTSYRNRANRMMAAFPAAAAREGFSENEFRQFIGKVRAMLTSIENNQATAADMAREAIRASEPPSPSRLAREKAVTDLFEARALTLYGDMLPRILDEAILDRNGRNDGRRFAGREWAIVITFKECGAYSLWQIARAGFTSDQYAVFETRAHNSLGLPPNTP